MQKLLLPSMEMSLAAEFLVARPWSDTSKSFCQGLDLKEFNFRDTHPFGRRHRLVGETSQLGSPLRWRAFKQERASTTYIAQKRKKIQETMLPSCHNFLTI